MIRQYLSNTNENTTVSIFQNFLELNKALIRKKKLTLFPTATDDVGQQDHNITGLGLVLVLVHPKKFRRPACRSWNHGPC